MSICHSKTPHIKECIKQADIIVTAMGEPHFLKGEWFKEGAIAIDVGINEVLKDEPLTSTGDLK